MGKLYLLGGETVAKRDARNVNAMAFQDAGGSPEVLVFPWARPSFDAGYRRRKRLIDYLRSLGAQSVSFSEYSDSPEEITAKVACADLVYLTGGQVVFSPPEQKPRGWTAFCAAIKAWSLAGAQAPLFWVDGAW